MHTYITAKLTSMNANYGAKSELNTNLHHKSYQQTFRFIFFNAAMVLTIVFCYLSHYKHDRSDYILRCCICIAILLICCHCNWSSSRFVISSFTCIACRTRSSATAKSTAHPSCLVGVLHDISRETICGWLINHFYVTGHESYRIRQITQNNGHYAVQGHSRSLILVPIESPYTTSY